MITTAKDGIMSAAGSAAKGSVAEVADVIVKGKTHKAGLQQLERFASSASIIYVWVISPTGDFQVVRTSPNDRFVESFLEEQGKIVLGHTNGPGCIDDDQLRARAAEYGMTFEEVRIGGKIKSKIIREPGSESHRRAMEHQTERLDHAKKKPLAKAVQDQAMLHVDAQALATQNLLAQMSAKLEKLAADNAALMAEKVGAKPKNGKGSDDGK